MDGNGCPEICAQIRQRSSSRAAASSLTQTVIALRLGAVNPGGGPDAVRRLLCAGVHRTGMYASNLRSKSPAPTVAGRHGRFEVGGGGRPSNAEDEARSEPNGVVCTSR
jgi:hypothetical protein